MRKERWKRSLIALALCLALVWEMIPAGFWAPVTMTALAAGEVREISDAQSLKSYLESDDDESIRITGDIIATNPGSVKYDECAYWIILGKGEKTLDLNGHAIEMNIDSGSIGGRSAIALIREGSSLTVLDSSGKNKGTIHSYGNLTGVGGVSADTSPFLMNSEVKYTEIFHVTGGNLKIYGGTFEAGRSKEVWLTNARHVNDWSPGLYDVNRRYDGYAWYQCNGDCIRMRSGSTTIYNGVFLGRGFRDISCSFDAGASRMYLDLTRAAAVYAFSGKLTIYGGEFQGRGNARALDVVETQTDFTLLGGLFETYTLERLVVPAASVGMTLSNYPLFLTSDGSSSRGGNNPGWNAGAVGIPAVCLNPELVTVTVDEEMIDSEEWDEKLEDRRDFSNGYWSVNAGFDPTTVQIAPRRDMPLAVTDSASGEAVEETFFWDGTTDVTLHAAFSEFWEGYPYDSHIWYTSVESYRELGMTPTVIIGGQTHNVGSVEKDVIRQSGATKQSQMDIDDDGNWTFDVDLKDYAPEEYKADDGFQVTIQAMEYLPRKEGSLLGGQGVIWEKTFFVKIVDGPSVTVHPQSKMASQRGGIVTLTAMAKNAEEAYWERVSPDSYSYEPDENFDGTVSNFEVSVSEVQKYRCVFRNKYGVVKTEPATVSYVPEFDSSNITEKTIYTAQNTAYLTTNADIRGIPDVKAVWYKDGTAVSELDADHYRESGTEMVIRYPKAEDAGEYTCRVYYPNGKGGQDSVDLTIIVTVVEGTPPNLISRVDLRGIGDLYIGDEAPTSLAWEDNRIYSAEVKWIVGVGKDGIIQSPNPGYTVTLEALGDNVFQYDGNGQLPWSMDGLGHGYAYGNPMQQAASITVTYTYDYYHALEYTPKDRLFLEERNFIVGKGEEVSIPLDFSIVCHERHDYEHVFTGDVHTEPNQPLPTGLSLTDVTIAADGKSGTARITGTVPEDIEPGEIKSAIAFAANGPNNPMMAVLSFYVTAPFEKFSASLPDLHTEHSWSAWVSDDDETHSRTCSVCGLKETADHDWDEEGELIDPGIEGQDGVRKHWCKDNCGNYLPEEVPYAELAEIPTCYTISYDLNGGTDPGDLKEFRLPENGEFVLPECSIIPPAGQTFYRWEIAGEQKKAGEICIVTQNMVLKPIWRNSAEVSGFTVSFAANGGNGEMDDMVVSVGGSLRLPACGFTAPEGKSFSGWFIKGEKCEIGQTISVDCDITVQALWADMPAEYRESDFWISGLAKSYTYTGSAIVPEFKLYYGTTVLKPDTDYAVKYKNNTNVTATGKPATFTISLKGNYAGTLSNAEYSFEIEPAVMSESAAASGLFGAEPVSDVVKTAKSGNVEKKLKPVIYFNGKQLKLNKDYTLEYNATDEGGKKAYADAGTWPVTVKAKGNNFTGSFTVNEILCDPAGMISMRNVAVNLDKKSVSLLEALPSAEVRQTEKNGQGELLHIDSDYTLQILGGDKAGKATYVFTAVPGSQYYGSKTVTVTVTKPVFSKLSDDTLKIDVDPGVYAKGGAQPEVTVKVTKPSGTVQLKEGVDYKLKYSSNKAVGRPGKVTVSGMGDYTGSKTIQFDIAQKNLSKVIFKAANPEYSKKTMAYEKTKLFLQDTDGKLLDKKDYDVVFTPENGALIPDVGAMIHVKVTGKNNYCGTAETDICVVDTGKSIQKAKIVYLDTDNVTPVKAYEYTGSPIKPDRFKLVVGSGKKAVEIDPSSYEVVAYSNNVNKGKATMTVRGTDEYGGLVTYKFTIAAKKK